MLNFCNHMLLFLVRYIFHPLPSIYTHWLKTMCILSIHTKHNHTWHANVLNMGLTCAKRRVIALSCRAHCLPGRPTKCKAPTGGGRPKSRRSEVKARHIVNCARVQYCLPFDVPSHNGELLLMLAS